MPAPWSNTTSLNRAAPGYVSSSESGTQELARPVMSSLVAEITRVEVAAGLAVIERVGRIKRSERDREYRRFTSQLTHRYAIIPLITSDLATAADLTQHHPLKAYDAVQLAVALRYRRILAAHQLTFVSSDNTLIIAAQAEGLSTDNPFDHVAPEDTVGSST